MAIIQTTLKEFIKDSTLFEKKRKRKTKKKKKAVKAANKGMSPSWYRAGGYGLHNNHHGGDSNMGGDGGGGGGGMGESLITELLSGIVSGSFSSNMAIGPAYSKHSNNPEAGMTTYASDDPGDWEWTEEEIEASNKESRAHQVFNSMINSPDVSRRDILTAIMNATGAAESTAITYYTRFHKGMDKKAATKDGTHTSDIDDDLGVNTDDLTMANDGDDGDDSDVNGDQEMESPQTPPDIQEFDDPTKAGVIRTVKNAHLVYKKQTDDGTFSELWIYNVHRNSHDELDIRRAILAGTDIPKTKTRSVDGIQHYTITTMGNAQLLKINGLYN